MNTKIDSILDYLEEQIQDMRIKDAIELLNGIRSLLKKVYNQRIKEYQDWIDNI